MRLVKDVVELDVVDSTNSYALERADEGLLVVAQMQTAGRGRRGRQWFSPRGLNLYMTLTVEAQDVKYPIIAGVAVYEALREHVPSSHDLRIKWPNDILIDGMKVSGILCEARGGITAIGIGINVNQDSWPEDLEHQAISLAEVIGHELDMSGIQKGCISKLEKWFDVYRDRGFGPIRTAFLRYSRFKNTWVMLHDDTRAIVIDLDMNGQVVVDIAGRIECISDPDAILEMDVS